MYPARYGQAILDHGDVLFDSGGKDPALGHQPGQHGSMETRQCIEADLVETHRDILVLPEVVDRSRQSPEETVRKEDGSACFTKVLV